ncbi:MAG: sensor histidine kinase [Pseudomonadota bacterium]
MTTPDFVDTPPEKFAWASVERSLEFSRALSEVRVGASAFSEIESHELERATVERVRAVLEIVHRFSPVKLATLWALKERAECGSLIAATSKYEQYLSPENDDQHRNFVCGFRESHLNAILNQYRDKIGARDDKKSRGRVHFEDIGALPPEKTFIPTEQISKLGLKRVLCLPFGVADENPGLSRQTPHFLLNLYLSDYADPDVDAFLRDDFIAAVEAKLISGIRALLNRRLVLITEAMSEVDLRDANTSARNAMDRALQRVLPKFVMCEQVMRLDVAGDGGLRAGPPVTLDANNHPVRASDNFDKLPDDIANGLMSLIDALFEQDHERAVLPDTRIALPSDIAAHLGGTALGEATSMLIGRVHNRAEPDQPRGYLILINRLNDYAMHCRANAKIADQFDWQDERVVNHVCSILDFIAELFTAEETRFNRAQILGHEMHAPTGFIRDTAERIHLSMSGKKKALPPGMLAKEISDIIDTCDFQRLLINSLMFGFQKRDLPPSKLYKVKRLDLNETAKYVSRLAIPVCRDAGVDPNAVNMRVFPELYFDSTAAVQVFWNILANAIKYRDPKDDGAFSYRGYAERVSRGELEASTSASTEFIARLAELGVTHGHLISFEDQGIGVPKAFAERIFRTGERADTDEVRAQRGAGLGLAVTRAIVNDHFGDAWLETLKDPTTFCVFLPDILERPDYQNLPAWRKRN